MLMPGFVPKLFLLSSKNVLGTSSIALIAPSLPNAPIKVLAFVGSINCIAFPTTGIWGISVATQFYIDGDSRYNRAEIRTTTNDSSYSYAHSPYCFIDDSGSSGAIYSTNSTGHLFDVVDTSTHKCRIDVEVQNGSVQTYVIKVLFVRYGDT